nr:venom polypeptide precursor [Doratifera vulnerans]
MSRFLVLFFVAVLVIQLSLTDAVDVCAQEGTRCRFNNFKKDPKYDCCEGLVCMPYEQRCVT